MIYSGDTLTARTSGQGSEVQISRAHADAGQSSTKSQRVQCPQGWLRATQSQAGQAGPSQAPAETDPSAERLLWPPNPAFLIGFLVCSTHTEAKVTHYLHYFFISIFTHLTDRSVLRMLIICWGLYLCHLMTVGEPKCSAADVTEECWESLGEEMRWFFTFTYV